MSLQIGICGAAGRMGKEIVSLCYADDLLRLGAAIEHADSAAIGVDAGELAGIGNIGVAITDDVCGALASVDVLINFTLAEALSEVLVHCCAASTPLVIGTTGVDSELQQAMAQAAQKIPIVFAPNMSVGVNLACKLIALAADSIGAESDIEILEAHHRAKKDAPSGTALRMGEIVAAALGQPLAECASYSRQSQFEERPAGQIGFHSMRGGDIAGEHTVLFIADGERLEITHKATSRDIFAKGALRAAAWIAGQAPGLYDMQDVLQL